MFTSLWNLDELNLSDNNITIIEENAFKGMHNILHIHLDRNMIERIPKHTFEHLVLLQDLHMSNNQIKVVTSDTFIPRGNLILLDISYNNITTLEYKDNASPLSTTLETLIMHNNNMTTTAGWLTHLALPSLKVLEISRNKLHGQLTNTAWPKGLDQVNVSENFIEDLKIIISDGIGLQTSLEQLNVRSNQITSISIEDEFKSAKGGLIGFYLGDNPFQCDCNLVWLQELITSQRGITNSYVIQDIDNLYCQTLLKHESGFMKDIKPDNFLCEYNVSCPTMCTCITQTCPCNIQQYSTAVKMIIFR